MVFVDASAWIDWLVPNATRHEEVRQAIEPLAEPVVATDHHFRAFGTVVVLP